jgi:hypothetical protein
MGHRYVLFEDYALEVPAAIVRSLQEIREKLIDAQTRVVDTGPARELLDRMARACGDLIHRHPEIDRDDFRIPITDALVDDLYELRVRIFEAVLEIWDLWQLPSAQALLNRINLEPPGLLARSVAQPSVTSPKPAQTTHRHAMRHSRATPANP